MPPKIKMEPKESVIERLGRSPDRGDAVSMSLFADYLAGSKIQAAGGRRDARTSTKAAHWYGRSTLTGLPGTAGKRTR